MQILLVVLGLSILLLVWIDVVITTLTVGGGGPLTSRLAQYSWSLALRIHHKHPNHSLLQMTGWITLLGVAAFWFLLTWTGWTIFFSAVHTAVVSTQNQQPANLWERIYFVGFTLSTLGIGDYHPQGAVWRIATAIASTNGFFLLTLTITYLLPVISAVAQKREIAIYIVSLGETPEEILMRAWNSRDFGQLDQHLISLTPMIVGMGEYYLTYPVLHYFHPVEVCKAFSLSLAVLDEALTLLQYGVKPAHRPDLAALGAANRATEACLNTLTSNYIKPATGNPPFPCLDLLRDYGIPIVSDDDFLAATQHLIEYRQILLALVQQDGWDWDMVSIHRPKVKWQK